MTWTPKPSQNARALRLFMESMDVIVEALCFPPDAVVDHMGRVARRVSIELRKLLFDSSPLLHAVLHRPRLHPLNDGGSIRGDIYRNERILSIAPGTSDGQLAGGIASHKWQIEVHPLHGLRFDSTAKNWTIYPMFNTDAVPLTLDRWLRQRLFCVNDREYSLFDTLKFVANKEAAHVDIDNDILLEDMERVHFGHTTYYHIIAILTASYLSSEYQASQQVDKSEWQRFSSYRTHEVTEPATFKGADMTGAEIDPVGLPNVFRETGIPLPTPGKPWKPVQVEESTVVYSKTS